MSGFTNNNLHTLVTWSEACDMQKFMEKYSRRVLPCLVRIAEGYACGDESQSQFAQNEVYLIYAVQSQPRVIATDRKGKYVSIPTNCKMNFHIINSGIAKNPAKPLSEIHDFLKKNRNADFVLEGDGPVSFCVGADQIDRRPLGPLRYDTTQDLKILHAYPIIDQYVHPKPIPIPGYVPLTLEVAEGLQFGTIAEFEKFHRDVCDGVKRFDRSKISITEDIVMTDEAPEGDYEYVIMNLKKTVQPSVDEYAAPGRVNDSVARGRHQNSNDGYVPPSRPPPPPRNRNSAPPTNSKPFMLPPIPSSPPPSTATSSTVRRARSPPAPPVPHRERLIASGGSLDSPDQPRSDVVQTPFHVPYLSIYDDDDDYDDDNDDEDDDYDRLRERMSDSESPGSQINLSPDSLFTDIGLVPTRIESLSVEEICSCLSLLHLGQYIEQFCNGDVDGQLLCALDENILKVDFRFSDFEAKKLMKFAKEGWRPLRRCVTPDIG